MQSRVFHVSGIHCKACKILIEDALGDLPEVQTVQVSLRRHQITIAGSFTSLDDNAIADLLTGPLKQHGYTVTVEKTQGKAAWGDFIYAVPAAALLISGFIALQGAGIVDLGNVQKVTYPTAFVVGLIASISTCMAIVGGLTLSISANYAKTGDRIVPQALFHAGRLVAFFVLGGVIGALGAEFQLSITGMFALSLLIGLVMLILGVNLLDVFHFARKLQPAMPAFIARHLLEVRKLNHTLTPALIGAVTFFLPCGFTQSMQFYTLSTGSFLAGALTMLSFALGTLPVLALLSFASTSLHSPKAKSVFFKTAGLVVIAFALFNVMNAMVAAGYIKPVIRM